MKVYIYSSRSTVPLINGGEIFYVVMMTLGGSRAIITLRAADRDRGRWCSCQRSWEVIMWNDRRKWLVVTSSCPLTLQVAERGSWLIVVITCKTCLTSVNDPDHYIRVDYVGHPDVSWKPSGYFMLISVVLTFLEAGRIWGRVMCIRMGWSGWYACYVSLWGVWHVFSGGGVPTLLSSIYSQPTCWSNKLINRTP